MARNLLTAAEIKSSKKPKLRDGDGLWLHTAKSGARYWVFIFSKHGRRREMGFGPLVDVSLADARRKAEEARKIVQNGGDPFSEMAERQVRVKPRTFGEVADEYIDRAVEDRKWRGAKTEAGWRNTLTVHAKPLRKIPVAEVTTDDVVRTLRSIWNTKHETATKVRERIKMVLDAAKVQGLRQGDNPAEWAGHLDQIMSKPDGAGRGHFAAMPYADVPSFLEHLRLATGMGARALEFAILTAARSGEVRGAVWHELDLKKRLWIIPAERMKAGKEHRVPLTSTAVKLLEIQSERRLSDLVFPGQNPRKPLSDMTLAKALKAVDANGYTVHGFRTSFRNWVLEETDFPDSLAEMALAHSVGDATVRAYRRGDALERRRRLMDEWAKFCS